MKERNRDARGALRQESRSSFRGSIFGKYITAFLLILLLSFLILALIITGVLNRHARASKSALATAAANETALYVGDRMHDFGLTELSAFVNEESRELGAILSVISESADGDLVIFLTDRDGRVVALSDGNGVRFDTAMQVPVEMLRDVISGLEIAYVGSIDGILEEQQLVRAATVKGADGTVVGAVFASSGSSAFEGILDTIMKTLAVAGVAVLFVALVAVYAITERIIGPLREMSRAAHSFASGDFEISVPVKGSDEVAELASSFNQMAESLKNLEKMRSTFMANVSHDLRTPMTTISGFIDSILAGAIPPEKHAHYLTIVSEEVKRLSRLVSLTLDISRIQAGDRKFVMTQFDVCETARLILISFEQKIEEKRLDVSFDTDSDHMTVYADRDAIHQILYNICDNAVKFSNEGGRLEIAIRAQRERKKVQITVYNEGQGIPKEDLPYVFDQFYKGDKSRGLDKTGVGLGMFISKAIVDAHKEEIWVDSEYGKNCEFGFTLSAKPPHEDRKLMSRRESL